MKQPGGIRASLSVSRGLELFPARTQETQLSDEGVARKVWLPLPTDGQARWQCGLGKAECPQEQKCLNCGSLHILLRPPEPGGACCLGNKPHAVFADSGMQILQTCTGPAQRSIRSAPWTS